VRIIKRIVPFFISLLLLLVSCGESNASIINIISFQPKEYDVVFYTHSTNNKLENIYYDAIIEIKANYPNEFSPVETEKKELSEVKELIDPASPTLLIAKNGKTVERISGQVSKQEIMKKLKQIVVEEKT
jgi:cytochrome oxidase Cu insertion factor (SCO1/SenC/PrrC family)